ncbi:MAG: TatD family hydrolase [Candidatus Omnitrophota bacterium]
MLNNMLQDSHLHIQGIELPSVIERFLNDIKSDGLVRLFNCATQPIDWPVIRSLSDSYHEIIPFFGIHPWFVDLAEEAAFIQLEKYLGVPKALVGEIGLDKSRKNIDFERQKDVFIRQLILAKKFNKPFAVHCVRSWEPTLRLIKEHAAGVRFLIHSFNGPLEIVQEAAKMGGFFSLAVKEFTRSGTPLCRVFEQLPGDRILLETDFPYQVKATDPVNYVTALRAGYETAAACRKVSVETFIRMVYDNGTIFANTTVDRSRSV